MKNFIFYCILDMTGSRASSQEYVHESKPNKVVECPSNEITWKIKFDNMKSAEAYALGKQKDDTIL